jgi:putative ABC transport system permease protein
VSADLLIRTSEDPRTLLPAVKAAIWSIDPDQLLASDNITLESYLDRLIAQRRFNMALLGILGVLGLVIAGVGIFGVMAYTVARRTNEIGVRIALGATPRRILSMVLRNADVVGRIGTGGRCRSRLVPDVVCEGVPLSAAADMTCACSPPRLPC